LTTNLTNDFEALCECTQPTKRGRQFEELFCRLLYKTGFDVHKNAKSAKPRQTDVFAEHGNDNFLFELKWLNRPVDISAIAQIRDRLRRVPGGTVGCICSMSGFTERLIHDIERDRHEYEVLLFNPLEIYSLFAGEVRIADLIDEKRRSVRTRGVVWFFRQGPRSALRRYTELSESNERLELSQESLHFRLSSNDISDIVFVSMPLIFDEYLWAFTLRVDLRSSTIDWIKEAFTAATNYLGMRGGGRFGIRQSESGWYGFGSENFLKEIGRHTERYRGYKGYIHHSEELVFVEELKHGLFLLTARQRLNEQSSIHSGEVTIRLPGVPADTQPYIRFIRSLAQEDLLFTPEQPLQRSVVRLSRVEIKLSDVITRIQAPKIGELGNFGISGLVIKNPFFNEAREIAKWSKAEVMLAFAEPEYLICTLDDWLDVEDEVDRYIMTGLEAVAIGEAVLLHPRCTWKKLTRRMDPNKKEDGFKQLESEWKQRHNLFNKIKKASERKRTRR